MWLLLLLVVPTLVMVFGFILGKDRITLKEFAAGEALMVFLIVCGYFIAKQQAVSDVEIWSGWLTKSEYYEEWWERVSCRHEISCTHIDKDGHAEHMNDGYEHLYDVDYNPPYWTGETSNGESLSVSQAYFERTTQLFKNREYVKIFRFSLDHGLGNKYVTTYGPPTSEMISTAVPHSFVNYIKADPSSVLRRVGQGDRFKDMIPVYPEVNKSSWEAPRFISVKVPIRDLAILNKQLSLVNARLGRSKQVNIIFIAVNSIDSSYIHSLEEKWLGGKKNDCVIVLGIPNYPKIDWVRIMSWSQSEDLKVSLRDKIQKIGSLEQGGEILETTEAEIGQKFVRRKMADFEYLMAGWQPSTGVLIVLFLVGLAGSIALSVLFYKEDLFNEEIPDWRRRTM